MSKSNFTNNTILYLQRIIKRMYLGIFGPIVLNKFIHDFKIQQLNLSSINELYDLLDKFNKYHIKISLMQTKSEFIYLLKLLKKRKIKNILEIGTADGGTLFFFSKIIDRNGYMISVDLPGNRFNRFPDWKIPLLLSFKCGHQKLFIIRSDSHQLSTYNKISKIIKDHGKLDLIFIDGDHSYSGVKKDFLLYKNLISKNGIIAFHDIAKKGDHNLVGDVPKFWNELKEKYIIQEIIENPNQIGCGIGILLERKSY